VFDFSLRQLQYFAKVAEVQSLAVAARELHISQPSISTAITKLEAALDVQLFVRHHAKGVSLTSAGARILIEVNGLLTHAEEVRRNAQGLAQQVRGRLHIGCFGPLAALYLPAIVTGFQQQYPEVELLLYEADNDALLTGLQVNRYDAVIVYQLDVPPTLQLEPLASFKPHVIMAPDHPLAAEKTVTLKQLAQWPMVLLDLPRSREYFSTLFESRGLHPMVSMRSPSFETVRSLVANGAGFSVLVTRPSSKQSYDGKWLIEKEIENKIPLTDVVLVHHKNERPTRLHQEFVAYAKQHFQALS